MGGCSFAPLRSWLKGYGFKYKYLAVVQITHCSQRHQSSLKTSVTIIYVLEQNGHETQLKEKSPCLINQHMKGEEKKKHLLRQSIPFDKCEVTLVITTGVLVQNFSLGSIVLPNSKDVMGKFRQLLKKETVENINAIW